MRNKKWTLHELSDLKYFYNVENMKSLDIAILLGRTTASVNHKIRDLGIQRNGNKWYTESEKLEIEKMFRQGYTIKQIAFKFKRTENAIRKILGRTVGTSSLCKGTIAKNQGVKYTDEDIEFIKEHFENTTAREIAEKLGRTRKAILQQVHHLRKQGKIDYIPIRKMDEDLKEYRNRQMHQYFIKY